MRGEETKSSIFSLLMNADFFIDDRVSAMLSVMVRFHMGVACGRDLILFPYRAKVADQMRPRSGPLLGGKPIAYVRIKTFAVREIQRGTDPVDIAHGKKVFESESIISRTTAATRKWECNLRPHTSHAATTI